MIVVVVSEERDLHHISFESYFCTECSMFYSRWVLACPLSVVGSRKGVKPVLECFFIRLMFRSSHLIQSLEKAKGVGNHLSMNHLMLQLQFKFKLQILQALVTE